MLKTKTRVFGLAFLLAATLPLSGCFETIAGPYTGPDVFEFDTITTNTLARSVSENAAMQSMRVNLIGPQRASEVVGQFTIAEESTATLGVHYDLPTGTSFTLPANTSSTNIQVQPMPSAGLTQGQSVTVVIELTGSQDGSIGVAENYKRYTLTITGSGS